MNAFPGPDALWLSCEHASGRIPNRYADLFRSARARSALASHRGLDIGALALARRIARHFGAHLESAAWSRLLIDLNRSAGRPALFSEFTHGLDADQRRLLVERYYSPYRNEVEAAVRRVIAAHGVVLHVAVHSFTAVLDGRPRAADVGLLYDPARALERELAARWKRELARIEPDLRVRRNYPYLGTADGLTTALRRRFDDAEYAGIELEVNQALLTGRTADAAARSIVASLERVFGA